MDKINFLEEVITIFGKINDGLSGLYEKPAILLMKQDSPEKLRYFIYCIKKYKTEYACALILTDSEACADVIEDYISYKDKLICVSTEDIDLLCRMANAEGYYNNWFYNQSLPMDDADTNLLLGCYNLDEYDIIARVYCRLSETPGKDDLSLNIHTDERKERYITNWEATSKYVFFHSVPESPADYDNRVSSTIESLYQNEWINEKNTIVLYGDTNFSLKSISKLQNDSQIKIADKNPKKKGMRRNGVSISPPEEILKPYDENIRILVTQIYYKSICEYLASLGYMVGKQVFVVNVSETIFNMSRERLWRQLGQRYNFAQNCYLKLREEHPDSVLFLSPWAASGDMYLDCLYLKDYIKKKHIEDYILVSTTVAAKRVAKLFGFDSVIITEEEALAVMWLARIEGFEKLNIMNMNVNVKPGQRTSYLHGIVDFNTFHQRLVFEEEERKLIPDMHQKDSTVIFKENALSQGKTVLIAPYSQTLGSIPESICESITRELKKRGYTVCTNVSSTELPIPGTRGIFIPYDQVLDFVNRAGGFIGMRSGLCDIVSSTPSKMVVLYQNKISTGESMMCFFGLQKMGLKRQDILEFVMEENSEEHIIEGILELFKNEE